MADYSKLKALLDKASQSLIGEGDEGKLQDAPAEGAITPEGSPIDLVAGGLGAKLGGAMARDASGIVGNEIGAIGSRPQQALPIMESAAPNVGSPATQQAAATLRANAPQQSLPDLLKSTQGQGKAMAFTDRLAQQTAARKLAALKSLSGQ